MPIRTFDTIRPIYKRTENMMLHAFKDIFASYNEDDYVMIMIIMKRNKEKKKNRKKII